LATKVVNGFGGGSHEFFLSYRIGSKKTFENVIKPPKNIKAPKPQKEIQEKPEKEKKEKVKKAVKKEEPKVEETIIEVDTLAAAMIKPVEKKKQAEVKKEKKKKVKEPKTRKQPKVKQTKAPKLKNIKPADAQDNSSSSNSAKEQEATQVQEPKVVVADQQKNVPDKVQQKATEENFQATKLVINDPNISKGFYVTVGVFEEEQNAIDYKAKMKNMGFKDSDYIFSSIKNYNYVYVLKTNDLTEARIMWLELRSAPGFEETWVYTVEVR
jgi:hypothetical protein